MADAGKTPGADSGATHPDTGTVSEPVAVTDVTVAVELPSLGVLVVGAVEVLEVTTPEASLSPLDTGVALTLGVEWMSTGTGTVEGGGDPDEGTKSGASARNGP